MSVDRDILTLILNGLTNISESVKDIKYIEECLENLSLKNATEVLKVIESGTKLIEDIYTQADSIKKEINEKYSAISKGKDITPEDNNVDSIVNQEIRNKNDKHQNGNSEDEDKSEVENKSDEVENKSDDEAKNKSDEEVKNKSDEEVKNKSDEEVKNKSDDEVKNKSDEGKNKSDAEVKNKRRRGIKEKIKSADEVKNKNDDEAKNESDDEAKNKSDDEAKNKSDDEAKNKSDDEAKNKSDDEAKNKSDDEAKNKSDDEAKNKSDEVHKSDDEHNKTDDEAHNRSDNESDKDSSNIANGSEDDDPLKVGTKEHKEKESGKGIMLRISNRNKVENISRTKSKKSDKSKKSKDCDQKSSKNDSDIENNDDKIGENEKVSVTADSPCPDVVESSILEESCNDTNKENSEQNKENIDIPKEVPKIRLVDLSKLIDPQRKKSVKFDSSVIILTSSDEETSTPKKIFNDKENGVLKSAMKKTPPAKLSVNRNLIEPKVHSESKTESSKRSRHKDSSSENSNSEKETDRKKIKLKIKLQPLSTVNHQSDSEDSDFEGKSRKSSRIKSKEKATEKRKELLKEKFEKTRIRNERSRSRALRGKKDAILKISDTSSLSDDSDIEEKNVKTKKLSSSKIEKTLNKRNQKAKDSKTNMEVDKNLFNYDLLYIPLPKIECSQLKEVYLSNKEILEIKRLANIKSLVKKRRSKNKTKSPDKSDSDEESDEPSKKKQKSKEKKSRKDKSEKEKEDKSTNKTSDNSSASDKEPGSEEEVDVPEPALSAPAEKDPLDADENMADAVMKELKNTEDNSNSEGNNSSDLDEKSEKQVSKKKKLSSKDKDEDNESKDTDDKSEDEDSSKDKKSTKKKDSKDKKKKDEEGDSKSEEESDDDNKSDQKSDSNSDSEKKKKKDWKKDKLLTVKIDSSDSDEDFSKFSKRKKSKEEIARKLKKSTVISDSDDSYKDEKDSSSDESEDKSKSDKDSSDEDDKAKKKAARKRIKRVRDSSSSDDDDKSTRKHIRRVLDRDSLSETTKQAEAEEKERKARIAEKQKKYNSIFEEKMDATIDKIVLEYDEKDDKEELLAVDKRLVEKLKPHQANGIRFMWDACFENLKRAKKEKGSGCILAHCMGLGKTLQVIALAHTLLSNSKKTGVERILVVCPVNTVLNWKAEFKKWLPKKSKLEIYELVNCKQNYERQYRVNEWHEDGGVLIIGYTMFRNLSSPDNKRLSKKMRESFAKGFVDPGPDLVICDEGHLLKNEKTHLSIAMNRITTARRIVLTGTPLQNNLKEYWCMVQFIKPNLLGTYKEYLNRFVNPITNGQYTDSTQHDIMLMRKRSHVLHKLLDGVVQRRDYSVLEPYLPPKHEYVLFVKLSPVQVKLYQHYMEKYARRQDGSNRTSFLFTDFQQLQRICTHPRVLGEKTAERREKLDDEEEDSEGSLKDFIDDGEQTPESSSSSSGSDSDSDKSSDSNKKKEKKKHKQQKVRVTRAQAAHRRENDEDSDPELVDINKQWWQEFCDGDELDNINNSGKLSLLFQILKECEEIGDKVLIFSQSLLALNCIEYFLEKIDEATQSGSSDKVGGYTGSWSIGLDYFRLDGSSSCDNRATWCDSFNNPKNTRARLFLISTKAGGLGINLVAANRVIIFDVSWNPSHDIQSIYRVYRFGQTKPCYIYRFVTYGAMEMKIYERQVTKQAISKRVIDEQQIDRHYNQNDLQELYKCDLEPEDRPIPLVPKDVLLGEMLQKYSDVIHQYHIHQSLLENKQDEGLNEEERKAAWDEFENEKVLRKTYNSFTGLSMNINANPHGLNMNINPQLIASALRNIVKNDNPTWSEVQIKGIIPALVQQLQAQLAENDTSMYTRVTQEIQRMQLQKMQEAYFQQQVRQMQQRQAMLNNSYYLDPAQVRNMVYGNRPANQPGPSVAVPRPSTATNDVIDLND